MMQTIFVVSGGLGFLGMAVLAGVRERYRESELAAFWQVVCMLVWVVSVVILAVYFPGHSVPDPR